MQLACLGFPDSCLREEANLDSCGQQVCVQALHPDTGAPFIAVWREPDWHLEFCQRDVDVGARVHSEASCDVVSKSFQEVITVAKEDKSTVL